MHHSRWELCLNSKAQHNAYAMKLLETGIYVLHWYAAGYYFKINFPVKKINRKMWFCTVKVSQESGQISWLSCWEDETTSSSIQQKSSWRNCPFSLLMEYILLKERWMAHPQSTAFFFPLGQNKSKPPPKNKIIYVCHWVIRLSPCETNTRQIILPKARSQATGCVKPVLNQHTGKENMVTSAPKSGLFWTCPGK